MKDVLTMYVWNDSSKEDVNDAADSVVGEITIDADSGVYNSGKITDVKVLDSDVHDSQYGHDSNYGNDSNYGRDSKNRPDSSSQELAAETSNASSVGLFAGLACAGAVLLAGALFAMRRKQVATKEENEELHNLAKAYYEGDDRFAYKSKWDDEATLTSSDLNPPVDPIESAQDVHVCSSAMCTECSGRKNRAERVQFIPSDLGTDVRCGGDRDEMSL